MIRKVLFIMAVFTVNILNAAYAGGEISAVNINYVYVRESVTDIEFTTEHSNPDGCTQTKRIRLKAGQLPNSDAMISVALSAMMAGKQVRAYVSTCEGGFPIAVALKVIN